MQDTAYLTPLMLTLKVAGLATCLALALGVGAGFILARKRFFGREFMDALCTMPLVLPPTVLGYYIIVAFGRNGRIGRLLEETLGVSLIFTWQGAVLAAAIVSFPLVYKSARAAFEGVDKDVEDAARTLGHTERSVFTSVTMPLAWRGILAGAMLSFARAMGEFGATLMVAGNLPGRTQTLSLAIYDAVQSGDEGAGMTLVLITTVACMLVLVGSGKVLKAVC